MIQLLFQFLSVLGVEYGFFRLTEYITFRLMMATGTSLILSLVFGHRFIVALYRRGAVDTAGQMISVRADEKKGTPTSGGLMIIATTLLSFYLWGDFLLHPQERLNPIVFCLAAGFLYFGLVGYFDDFQKVRGRSSLRGLSQLAKTALQLLFIAPFAALFVLAEQNPVPVELRTLLFVPFHKHAVLDLGPVPFMVFVLVVFFGILNAVNISDGMDGLASGLAVQTIGTFGVFAYIIGSSRLARHYLFPNVPGVEEIAVFGACLIGAILGFLWYNAYPAEVFMGDTGSLALGGAIAMMAFFIKQEMLLFIAGGVFIFEGFSSQIQEKVGERLLRRRLFHRGPFHDSLKHQGVAEPKVVARLLIVGVLLTLVALLSIKVR
jgi:phospho-N-acetylmuramoyl-pentapeptide-transferase